MAKSKTQAEKANEKQERHAENRKKVEENRIKERERHAQELQIQQNEQREKEKEEVGLSAKEKRKKKKEKKQEAENAAKQSMKQQEEQRKRDAIYRKTAHIGEDNDPLSEESDNENDLLQNPNAHAPWIANNISKEEWHTQNSKFHDEQQKLAEKEIAQMEKEKETKLKRISRKDKGKKDGLPRMHLMGQT